MGVRWSSVTARLRRRPCRLPAALLGLLGAAAIRNPDLIEAGDTTADGAGLSAIPSKAACSQASARAGDHRQGTSPHEIRLLRSRVGRRLASTRRRRVPMAERRHAQWKPTQDLDDRAGPWMARRGDPQAMPEGELARRVVELAFGKGSRL